MRYLILIAVTIAFLVVVTVLSYILIIGRWDPFVDDGPFHGVPRDHSHLQKPIQTFSVYSGNQFEVYPKLPEDPAPTVLLRAGDGSVKWCVYAVGQEETVVDSIRFSSLRKNPFGRPCVLGTVKWTFGNERTLWFINKNGELVEYYFSW